MPFVLPTDAQNARHTTLPFETPAVGAALSRTALVASPSVRLVLIEMPAGYKTVPHRHPHASESFIVVGGSGTFVLGDSGPIQVASGDVLHSVADEIHAIEAGGTGLRFIACVGPNEDRPDEEIAVPHDDPESR